MATLGENLPAICPDRPDWEAKRPRFSVLPAPARNMRIHCGAPMAVHEALTAVAMQQIHFAVKRELGSKLGSRGA